MVIYILYVLEQELWHSSFQVAYGDFLIVV